MFRSSVERGKRRVLERVEMKYTLWIIEELLDE